MDVGFPRMVYYFVEDAVGEHPPRTVFQCKATNSNTGHAQALFQLPKGIDGHSVANALRSAHADGHYCRAAQIQSVLNLR